LKAHYKYKIVVMRRPNNKKRAAFNNDYLIAMQLYYLNKKEIKKEARLPKNDFRNNVVKKVADKYSTKRFIYIRKAISKIAAIW